SVTPVAVATSAHVGQVQMWQWQASNDGRILALAGNAILHARELILEDVTTGTAIWSATSRDAQLAFNQHNPFVRLGAHLVAGHTYRLTAECASDCSDTPVMALALANRQ
ncbi:MAG TPA: hypothetical protein VM100_06155, partial [Longimicrobiales bacterium]|nr:hypothetical protein [Longimicrobiales bacterium]